MINRGNFLGWMLVAAAICAPLHVAAAGHDHEVGKGDECSALTGSWQFDARRTASPFFRPANLTFHAGGTISTISGSNLVPLGFSGRSGLTGECIRTGSHTYRVILEEFLYQAGWVAGRFLVDMDLKHNHRTDTVTGVGRFKITVFRTGEAPTSGLCTAEPPIAQSNVDLYRDGTYEHICRQANDLVLQGVRLGREPFFADGPN